MSDEDAVVLSMILAAGQGDNATLYGYLDDVDKKGLLPDLTVRMAWFAAAALRGAYGPDGWVDKVRQMLLEHEVEKIGREVEGDQ